MRNVIIRSQFVIIIGFFLMSIFSLTGPVFAAQIRISWNPNSESDLAGYRIYYGTSSKSYSGIVDVGNETIFTLTGLTSGTTYFIAVTAYDTSFNQSGYSNEVSGIAIDPEPLLPSPPPTITPSPIPEPTPTSTPSPTGNQSKGKKLGWDKKSTTTQVYLAVSEMNTAEPPSGNIKKYEISTQEVQTTSTATVNSTAQVETVLDATKAPALDSNNQIKDSSKSLWSSEPDGKKSSKGGVGEVLLKRGKPRKILTNLGDPNLTTESNEFSTSNEKITPELLGLSPKDVLERERLIQYIHGYDVYSKEKAKTSLQKRKWLLGAIVNSRPLVIPYDDSKKVIYVGANDGMLHAFDDATGDELWCFIPAELLARLKELTQGNGLKYFVDGSPKAYITNSQKIIVFGLRRGGNNYYALDVTDPENPRILWKIGPETPGYSEMGQTWSTPRFGRIRYGSSSRVACFIGGGYDENQDRKIPSNDEKGRAIYAVDLLTGEQIWKWDFAKDPRMNYSIPSDISRVDTNGDGYTDRLYVGDTGGRLWRFDIKLGDPKAWSGRITFNANLNSTGSSKRKIFYRPDVVLEQDHEIIYFGTGDREHPNEQNVVNRIYAVKDRNIESILAEDDLVDVTKNPSSVQNINSKDGWFISLDANKGEKVFGDPFVGFKVTYLSTFTPSLDGKEGISRIYALDYMNGNPIINLNASNDNTAGVKIDLSDRSKVIGTGIPSGTVVSELNGRLFAYTGIPGGLYYTPLRRNSVILPISWRQVF